MASTPCDVPKQNSKALPQTAPVAIDAGSSLRDLDDTALNRLWRDADKRSTPPQDWRSPRMQKKTPGPTPSIEESAAQIEFDRAEKEVQRRIGIMSDEILGAHLRRLKIDRHSIIPPSDDSPDTGDWPASLLAREWRKRQKQREEIEKEAQLEELKARVSRMNDAELAAEWKRIEDVTREDRSAEQHNRLDFIRYEMARRDKAHMSAVDRRDKIRTVVAIAGFVVAGAAYMRTQPLNSVASTGNAPALIVPSTSAPSKESGATPDPVPSRTPSNAAP
jgi:hypothetical protein